MALEVVDVAGRIVLRRSIGPFEGGPHMLRFDARDDEGRSLPAGLWFVRLRSASGTVETVRLVKIRG
jgi:hypothetical protein